MYKIIISPYSRALRNGKNNPKNYPHWQELVSQMKSRGIYVIQVGVKGEEKIEGVDEMRLNLSLDELQALVKECNLWISVDNFFQHFCWLHGKFGIALFGQSDPNIFGHKENLNLLRDRKYLREKQFDIWECCEYNANAFVEPYEIIAKIGK